jgi:Ser/Thr protein kinase RdoA (MazF antagonist)
LEARGFAGVPRWLGRDSAGREILSFIPGDVPSELGSFSADQIRGAARLLRGYHDATLDFEALGTSEIVCHGDASPCNCVFRDGLPYAFIDFDAAHAGDRRNDVGYAAWLWLDIGNDELDPIQQGRRLGQFFAAYYRSDFNDAILAVTDAQTELSQRDGTPAPTQEWARQCLQWSKNNRAALESGLASARQAAF